MQKEVSNTQPNPQDSPRVRQTTRVESRDKIGSDQHVIVCTDKVMRLSPQSGEMTFNEKIAVKTTWGEECE